MWVTPRLETPGVVLRPLELDDASALFAAHGDEQTHRFWSAPAHKDADQTRAHIEATLKLGRAWAITESGGEALGRIALFEARDGVGEIGAPPRGAGLPPRRLVLCAITPLASAGSTASAPISTLTQRLDLALPPRRLPARGPPAPKLENPSRPTRQRDHE